MIEKNISAEKWETLALFIASGAFVGAAPAAPGTFGTLAALPLWWLLSHVSAAWFFLLLLLLTILAVWAAGQAERILHQPDSGVIVIDEIVGLLLAAALVPFTWPHVVAAFLLFRFFDILKPFPVSWCDQNLHGGFGVVVDDLVAGIMAHLVLRLLMMAGF